jgi:hypothetical protein
MRAVVFPVRDRCRRTAGSDWDDVAAGRAPADAHCRERGSAFALSGGDRPPARGGLECQSHALLTHPPRARSPASSPRVRRRATTPSISRSSATPSGTCWGGTSRSARRFSPRRRARPTRSASSSRRSRAARASTPSRRRAVPPSSSVPAGRARCERWPDASPRGDASRPATSRRPHRRELAENTPVVEGRTSRASALHPPARRAARRLAEETSCEQPSAVVRGVRHAPAATSKDRPPRRAMDCFGTRRARRHSSAQMEPPLSRAAQMAAADRATAGARRRRDTLLPRCSPRRRVPRRSARHRWCSAVQRPSRLLSSPPAPATAARRRAPRAGGPPLLRSARSRACARCMTAREERIELDGVSRARVGLIVGPT